jgi:hypothetical protein
VLNSSPDNDKAWTSRGYLKWSRQTLALFFQLCQASQRYGSARQHWISDEAGKHKFLTDPGFELPKDRLVLQQAELQSDAPSLPGTETPVICEARQITGFLAR